ncbi:MAG: hypothetical protein AMJ93_11120 [Anaerolineae bacterium SM23_84]|nr:MAG: hypothetical protein AMJ93_11120 [Anaerolineae bacterium SM23_84]
MAVTLPARRGGRPHARSASLWTTLSPMLAGGGVPFCRLVVLGVLARLRTTINRARDGALDQSCSLNRAMGELRDVVDGKSADCGWMTL